MELKVPILLLVTLLVSSVDSAIVKRQANKCPEGWDPSPCTCKDGSNNGNPTVTCDNAASGDQLKEIFAKLTTDVAFDDFVMKNSQVTSLPAGVFGKASFRMFSISNTKLQTVDDSAFKGSEQTAEVFLLEKNNFESFNFKSLAPLAKLVNFELTDDKLRSVPDEAFGDKSTLSHISLNGNQIATLGKNAFAKLPKLRKVDLGNNKLAELQVDSFNLSPDISPITLLLGNNEISKIDKNAFKNLKLVTFELGENKLEKLDQDIWEPIINSMMTTSASLGVDGNPFSCEADAIGWIKNLTPEKQSRFVGFTCKDGKALQEVEV